METEKSITLENLVAPYSEEGFSEQLLSCGIPEASIEEIRSTYTGDDPTDNLLSRLYADIERSETRIIDGERHLQFTGAFITDGRSVLLERHPDFGKKGYGMGGLFAYSGIEPADNILKEIGEETPFDPNNSRLRLVSESADSSISPRLPGVMSHRNGYFFIYKVDSLDDMPEIHQGSDGDPHELYVVSLADIKTDDKIAKGWRGDAIKHILDNSEFTEYVPPVLWGIRGDLNIIDGGAEWALARRVNSDRSYANLAKAAIAQIKYDGQTNPPTLVLSNSSEDCRRARRRIHQILNSDSIIDNDAVTELESIIDQFTSPTRFRKDLS